MSPLPLNLVKETYRINYFLDKLREDINNCSPESVSDATSALSIIRLAFDNNDLDVESYNKMSHEVHDLARNFMLKCNCSKID